jgi:hypothetical protein
LSEAAAWDEKKHPRDKGKFASKPGGGDGDKADDGNGEEPEPKATKARTFKSREEADTWLKSDTSINPQVTDVENDMLGRYKGDEFLDINDELRAGGYTASGADEIIDGVMAKTSLSEPVTVYRGVSYDVFEDEDDLTDGFFEDAAYISTSLDRSTAQRFSDGVVMEIRVPEGAHALNMEQWKTSGGSESELLLPRNSTFHVISDTGVDDDERQMVVELVL